jgi:hypothetical protein
MRSVLKQQTARNGKVVVCPSFEGEGIEHFKKMEEWCEVVDFDELINNEVRKQKFASSLLTSCLTLKKPVPSYIAGALFVDTVEGRMGKAEGGGKLLVLKGFPQDVEQLKMMLSKSDTIGSLCGLFVESSRIRKNMKADESLLAQYEKLC